MEERGRVHVQRRGYQDQGHFRHSRRLKSQSRVRIRSGRQRSRIHHHGRVEGNHARGRISHQSGRGRFRSGRRHLEGNGPVSRKQKAEGRKRKAASHRVAAFCLLPSAYCSPVFSNISSCSFDTGFGFFVRNGLPTTPKTWIADKAALETNTR